MSKKEPKIILNMGRCKHCGQVLLSLTTHDFRMCKCGKAFTDGGRDYIRRGGDIEDFTVVQWSDGTLHFAGNEEE